MIYEYVARPVQYGDPYTYTYTYTVQHNSTPCFVEGDRTAGYLLNLSS